MRILRISLLLLFVSLILVPVAGQRSGLESITIHDLKMHMKFLASDELEGRNTGEKGNQVAARYLAVQAEQLGLAPAGPGNGYLQPFTIEERSYEAEASRITIYDGDFARMVNRDAFLIIPPVRQDQLTIEGEVVFAGYGIRDDEHGYNDFENIDVSDRVVLIMNRAPMNEDGTEVQFDHEKWTGIQNMRYKIPYIYSQGARAVLLVLDPKSGFSSIEDADPGIADYLGRSLSLKSSGERSKEPEIRPRTVMIHRRVADQLLSGTGKSLAELQQEIDREQAPRSFILENRRVEINLQMKKRDMEVANVFGLIEGRDPILKDETVIYVAHYDHLGTDGEGGVFNGADDNASGTVALIEIAEAFLKEKKRAARSIGILWVAAEEVGLFGSRYFTENPLVPLEKTAAVINLDMVGRSKTEEDMKSNRRELTILGGDTIKVIGGLQSSVLMRISEKTLEEIGLVGNYHYNNQDDPGRYFYRSDHINFARKDIPVLFYSTGTHRDYHRVTDVEERIDYDKFIKVTRFGFKVGFNIAQYKDPITVDHPMSGW
jgi:hypothetical protein